jgi:hypothetical protein
LTAVSSSDPIAISLQSNPFPWSFSYTSLFFLPISTIPTHAPWAAGDTTKAALIRIGSNSHPTIDHQRAATTPTPFHFSSPSCFTSLPPHSWAEAVTTVPACRKDEAATTKSPIHSIAAEEQAGLASAAPIKNGFPSLFLQICRTRERTTQTQILGPLDVQHPPQVETAPPKSAF